MAAPIGTSVIATARLKARSQKAAHLERMIGDMKAPGTLDFATAMVAMQEISKLA